MYKGNLAQHSTKNKFNNLAEPLDWRSLRSLQWMGYHRSRRPGPRHRPSS